MTDPNRLNFSATGMPPAAPARDRRTGNMVQFTATDRVSREPLDLAERKAKRKRILDARIAVARREAIEFHRSINCAQQIIHGREPHEPCKGGPINCLCECHDPAPDAEARP